MGGKSIPLHMARIFELPFQALQTDSFLQALSQIPWQTILRTYLSHPYRQQKDISRHLNKEYATILQSLPTVPRIIKPSSLTFTFKAMPAATLFIAPEITGIPCFSPVTFDALSSVSPTTS